MNGYHEHAVMSQFCRWFQLYERDDTLLKNQIDILAKEVELKSGLGEAKGHDAYQERFKKLPKAWENAHFIKSSEVTVNEDGTCALSAQVHYFNQGMLPENEIRTANLTYTAMLSKTEGELPKFTKIEITPNKEQKAEKVTEWKDAYPENRLKSLVHQWLYLIEDPARKFEPFKELLADGYALHFSSGKIETFEDFEKWFRGPASSVKASTHQIKDFSYEILGENKYALHAKFDWQGIFPNGKEMKAQTEHKWIVIDNPAERFARIREIKVKVLKPFAPLTRE